MTEPDRLPEPGPDAGIDDIEADIERTRRELGTTVGALSAKLDVKTRASEKARELRSNPVMPAALVVALLAVIGLVVWRRSRR
jgi:hypothetical protein